MTKKQIDNVEQSKRDGTVTTEEGVVVNAKTGVADEQPEMEKARELSFDEVANLVGELEPGDEGWVPLDEKGNIIGPAKKGIAPAGQLAASVVAPVDTRPHALQTPSGAHLMQRMNPDPEKSERPEHTNLG